MVLIAVKTLTNKTITLNVKMSDDIDAVKAKLSEKLGREVPFMIFNGTKLTGYEKVFGFVPEFVEGAEKKEAEKKEAEKKEEAEDTSSEDEESIPSSSDDPDHELLPQPQA